MRIVVKRVLIKQTNKQTNKQASKQTKTRERERERGKGTDRNKGDTADFFAFFVKRDWGYLYFFS